MSERATWTPKSGLVFFIAGALVACVPAETTPLRNGWLKMAAELRLGPSLLRAIENPDATPDRDIYVATALGVWHGRRCQTGGPWPSSKLPPRGHPVWPDLEEIATNERRDQRRHEQADPYDGSGWGAWEAP